MKRALLVIPTLFALVTLAVAQQNPIRVVVEFHGDPDASVVTNAGGRVIARLSSSPSLVALVPPQALQGILRNPNVVDVDADRPVRVNPLGKKPTPPPPAQSTDWGVNRIDADLAWSSTRGAGIDVHVVDTGIDNRHADFKDAAGVSRVVLGPNFNNTGRTSLDDNGHGTHVAGTIGASDNAIGVVGIANECRLTAVKVLDRSGSGWLTDIVLGIDWSVANGAEVINLSLGSTADVASLHASVDAAVAAGVVVCAAAGNEADQGNPVEYPGAYESVICVAATDSSDVRAYWSEYGPQVDVAAPGVSIKSTWKGGGYSTISGTSMATPHVCGSAALAFASGRYSDTNGNGRINDEIRAALEATADDLGAAGRDDYYGSGLVDAQEVTTGIQTTP